MKLKAKILTLVLALAMLFSIIAVLTIPAGAAESDSEGTIIYFTPSSDDYWKKDGARFAAYYWEGEDSSKIEGWSDVVDFNGDGVYQFTLPAEFSNFKFVRMNSSTTENKWENKWNEDSNLTVQADGKNHYTINSGWDNVGGTWSTYSIDWNSYEMKIAGSFTNPEWGDGAVELSKSGDIASCTVAIKAGTHKFKVIVGEDWYGNASSVENDGTTTDLQMSKSEESNCTIEVSKCGNYTFDYHMSTGMLSITRAESYDAHSWDEGTITTEPQCEVAGQKTYTCTVDGCGQTKFEPINETGHSFNGGATCATCGAANPDYVPPYATLVTDASTLKAGDKILLVGYNKNADTYHAMTSQNSGNYRNQVEISVVDNSIAQEPEGVQIVTLGGSAGAWTLGVGDNQYLYHDTTTKNTVSTGSSPYDWTIAITDGVATINSVNTSARYLQYNSSATRFACYTGTQNNPSIFKITQTESSCEHTPNGDGKEIFPTCTSGGYTKHTCSKCGETYTANETEKLEHNEVIDAAVAATCTTTGLTAGSHCSVCETVITEQEEIPMIAHNYVSGVCSCGDREKVAVLVTDASLLKAGDQIFVVCTGHAVAMGAQNGSYRNTVSVTFTNNTMTIIDGAQVITLGGSEGAWTLGVSDTEYLYWDSGNDVKTGTTAYDWNITIASDGIATISSVETPERELQYNASSPRFACYTGTQQDISIYKVVDMNCEHTSSGDATCNKAETCTKCGITLNPATGVHTYENHVCKVCNQDDPNHYFVMTIPDANAAADGKNVQVMGTVSEITEKWSEQFKNMNVIITDSDGNKFTLYRLKTNVAVGDVIFVRGALSTYNETKQISYGTAVSGITIYFENKFNWSDVSCHYWLTIGEGEDAKTVDTVWPGVAMTATGETAGFGAAIYKVVLPVDVAGVVFNGNGGASQSPDIKEVDFKSCLAFWLSDDNSSYGSCDKHTNAAAKRENETPANNGCVTTTTFDSVVYCSVCNAKVSSTPSTEITYNHTFGDVVAASGATCTKDGSTEPYKQCTACHYYFGKDAEATTAGSESNPWVIAKTGHTEEEIPAVAATCTTAGSTAGTKCSVCETVIKAPETVDALGHTEKEIPAVAATCTTAGSTAGTKCSVCETVIKAPETIDAKGHTEEVVPGKAATCTETGLTDGKKCSVCGTVTVKQQTIVATGHEYTDKVTAPTCTAGGYTTYTCSCGDSYTANETGALGHTNAAAKRENSTSTTEDCITTTTFDSVVYCSVCKVKVSSTPSTEITYNHTFGDVVAASAATCTKDGSTDPYKQCTACHYYFGKDAEATTAGSKSNPWVIPATGKHTEETIPAVAPDCTNTGLTEGKKCSVCGETLVAQETVDAKGHSWTNANCTTPKTCSVCKATEGAALGHNFEGGIYTDPTFEADGYWTCANNGCGVTQTDDGTKRIAVAQVGENKYESLQEAINAASNGATVKLLKDITLEETITIAKGNTLVLDLAGKTIAGTDGKASSNFELIANKGTLTINDSVGGGAITLTSTTDRDWNAYSAVIANFGGTLTIEGGKVHHLGGTDMAYAIDNNSTLGNTVLTINGGEVLSTNYRAVRLFANSTTHTNSVTVNGGTVKGGSAALGNNAWSTAIWMQNPNTNANNATLTVGADAKVGSVNVYSTGDTSGLKLSVASGALIQGEEAGDASVLNNTADENYEIKEIDGKFVIAKVPAAAEVNGNEYVTLQAAIDAAGKGDVITVLRDVTIDAVDGEPETHAWVKASQDVVIDLGGYTVTGAFFINGTATIKNGSIVNNDNVSGIETQGNLTLINVNITSNRHAVRISGGTTVIESGMYQTVGTSGTRHTINASGDSTVLTINGGTFIGAGHANLGATGNCVMIQSSKLVATINGGTYYGANGVEGPICAAASLTINGGKFKDTTATWRYHATTSADKCAYIVDGYYEVKDHTSVTDAAVAPTCTKTGLTEGSHCSNCSKVLVAQEVVDALGHTSVTDKAVAPTCTETGLTAGSHCSVCNETLVAQEEVPATGHTYVKGECANGCGDKKYIETEGAVVSGHSNVDELLEALKSNSALAENFKIVLPEGVELVVKLTKVDGVTKIVFDVAPMKGDVQETLGNKITFRLPVPAAVTTTHAHVYHEGIWIGTYEIKGEGNSKYVELSAKDFSEYSLEFVNAVAMVGDFGYETLGEALDKVAAGDTVKLVADITLTDTITLSKAITLDGNGHTITSTADVAITVTAEDITINNLTVNVAASKFAISIYRSAYVNADFNLAEGADIISGEISDKAGVKVYFKREYKEILATRGFLTSEAENGMLLLGTRLSYYIGSNGNWYFNNEDTGHKAVATDGATPEIGENGNWWIGGVDTGTKAEAVNGATPTIGENGNWWIGEVDTGTKATSQIPYIKDGYWYIDGEKTEHSAQGVDGQTPYIGENGNWWVGETDLDVSAKGQDGETPTFKIENGNLYAKFPSDKDWTPLGTVVGADGKTPEFKIENDVLHVSYDNGTSWTPLGNIAGADGEDGKTPEFKIDETTGNLMVSYDDGETWETVGVVVGADGKPGSDGKPGADGKDGITPKFELRGKELFVSYDNGTTWASLGQIAGADGSDGSDGADGKTPKFKIENDYLWVSYDEGANWTKLDKVTGEDGATGASGITPKFEIKGGNLMISYDNGSTWASLGNVLGSDGAAGAAGITPTIGENGCWIIGGVQTELPSRGNDGQSPHIGDNGNWFIGNNDLGVPARGQDGKTPSFRIENGNLQVSFGEDVWQDLGRVVGENGLTPVIGENGNWWLGDLDTGVSASGANGATPHIGENGNWWIGNTDTGVKAIGRDGNDNNKIVLISIGIAALCICVTVIAVATATRRRPWWILT